VQDYFPPAKIGFGNFIYVYRGTSRFGAGSAGVNFFALAKVPFANSDTNSMIPGLTVAQAYQMDAKVDDGLPESGKVQAYFPNAATAEVDWAPWAATPSSTTCFDTTSKQYSITQSGGANVNCALSFPFQ
jgi:hypothetical protein